MFKVKNKDTKTTSTTLVFLLLTFNMVPAGWEHSFLLFSYLDGYVY